MSNIGLERAVRAWGVKVVRTQVGDRYVVEEMRKHGYNLGGEQSGHLIFLDHATTGDGIVAALQRARGHVPRRASRCRELARGLRAGAADAAQRGGQARSASWSELPDVQRRSRAVEKKLGKDGRVLVRFSGTEPKARVLIEGTDATRERGARPGDRRGAHQGAER